MICKYLFTNVSSLALENTDQNHRLRLSLYPSCVDVGFKLRRLLHLQTYRPKLRLFIQLLGSFPLAYLYPQFKTWVIYTFPFMPFPPSGIIHTHIDLFSWWLDYLYGRSLKRSGFDSRSSLNLFRFFFNRLVCFFNCEDHFHSHIIYCSFFNMSYLTLCLQFSCAHSKRTQNIILHLFKYSNALSVPHPGYQTRDTGMATQMQLKVILVGNRIATGVV